MCICICIQYSTLSGCICRCYLGTCLGTASNSRCADQQGDKLAAISKGSSSLDLLGGPELETLWISLINILATACGKEKHCGSLINSPRAICDKGEELDVAEASRPLTTK